MERQEKAVAVSALKEKLARAQSLVLVNFRGLTVDADTKLRNEFRASGCEYKVVKNTLLGLAVKGSPMDRLDDLLVGPTAIAYSYEDPAVPAKVATKIAKENQKFSIKGGYVDGRALDKSGVEALSQLPGKDELRATLLATFNAAAQGFVALLNAAPQNFAYLLAAREEKLKEGGGPSEPAEQGPAA